MAKLCKAALFFTLSALIFQFSACSQNSQTKKSSYNASSRIVIWTSCSEFAQYIELYNKNHKDDMAILVYKENPALSLPPAKDELPPDIIIGSWLQNDSLQKNFKNLDYLFDRQELNSTMFYQNLFEAGKYKNSQKLLPVSFNLPAIVFDKNNSDLINDSYTLSLNQIREISSKYNETKKNGAFSKIGFAPLNNENFLYLAAKIYGADFREEKGQIKWNDAELSDSLSFLRDWIISEHKSAQTESDFSFKYLFTPYYRQVTSGRTLFATTTSDVLFKDIKNQDYQIDYRWIAQDKKLPIEDSQIMLGIYKKANNIVGATEFVTWFFNPESQKEILERKETLNLETQLFGIAGGFSSVKEVTEHILPLYYHQLLENVPPSGMLQVPQRLSPRWESYKAMVIDPYLENTITLTSAAEIQPIEEYEKEWRKKVFDN